MKVSKIVKDNKHEGLRLKAKGKTIDFFSIKEKKEDDDISIMYNYLFLPKKTAQLMFVYANKKGDFWKNKEKKTEYFKVTKKNITIGKLFVSWALKHV